MADAHKVKPTFLVIPDGVRDGKLRLSLQVTPELDPNGSFGLADWPAGVANLPIIRLFQADVTGSEGQPDVANVRDLGQMRPGLTIPQDASALWNEIFPDIDLLAKALETRTQEQTTTVTANDLALAPHVDIAMLEAALLENRQLLATASIKQKKRKTKSLVAQIQAQRADLARKMEVWALDHEHLDAAGRVGADTSNRARVAKAVSPAAKSAPWRKYDHCHAKLRAILTAKQLNGEHDEDLVCAVEATRPETAEARLRTGLTSFQDSIVIGPPTEPPDKDQSLPWADERRKLAAIHAFPTIARYLGMIIDIEIEETDWVGGRYGAIAAAVTLAPSDTDCWTAYANHAATESGAGTAKSPRIKASKAAPRVPQRFFGPCDMNEAFAKAEIENQEYVRGLLNLQQLINKTSRRFSLSTIDVVNSARQEIAYASAAKAKGEIGLSLPDLSGRGIALIDSDAEAAAKRARDRRDYLIKPGTRKLHFAADLVRGLRPSVAVLPRTAPTTFPSNIERWRSLCTRTLTYKSAGLAGFQDERDREREIGVVRTEVGEQTNYDRNNGNATTQITLIHHELFVWTGDSLTVATRTEDDKWNGDMPPPGEMQVPAGKDLPLGITFGLPTTIKNKIGLPPLREGMNYVFGVSAAFVNGCGLNAPEAISAHAASPETTLGSGDVTRFLPFTFERVSRIPSPIILFPSDDEPLVNRKNISSLYGENLMSLVVRDRQFGGPAGRSRPPRRYLFPERVNFDRGEQQRQFDNVRDSVPPGALSDRHCAVRRDKSTGTFPLAIDGKIMFPGANGGADADRPSRGAVLQFEAGARDAKPYYPDAYTIGVTTVATNRVPSNAPDVPNATAAFRGGADPAIRSLPAIIEVRPLRATLPDGRRVRVSFEDEDVDNVDEPLKKIVFELAPATVVDLDITPSVDPVRFAEAHYLRRTIAQSSGISRHRTERLAKQAADLVANDLWEELHGPQVLRLTHAVRRPAVPEITLPARMRFKGKPESGLGVVMLSETAEGDLSNVRGETRWEEYVSDHSGKPLSEWKSIAGGATCFFVGSLIVDGPSTATVNCEAHWREVGPEAVRLARPELPPGEARWVFDVPINQARMFSIQDISSALSPRGKIDQGARPDDRSLVTLVDVTRNEDVLRRRSYSFPDGRARCLMVDLLAISRFTDYYSPDGATSNVVGPDYRPVRGEAGEITATSREIWVPCTFRPAALDVRRIAHEFTIKSGVDKKKGIFTFSRTTLLRVEIGPDGFSSGADERIALVFNASPPADICDYFMDERLRPFGQFVTRWGGDPISGTSVRRTELVPCDFAAAGSACTTTGRPTYDLYPGSDPVTATQGDPAPPLKATIMDFPLIFDAIEGGFYAEIPFEQPDAIAQGYRPILQLGLSRFQPHSVAGYELSLPVGKDVHPLPARSGTVRFDKKRPTNKFRLKLEGPTLPNHWLEVSLMTRSTDEGSPWIPAWSIDLKRFMVWKLENPGPNGWDEPKDPRAWLDMHLYPGAMHNLGLQIEEYEPAEIVDRDAEPSEPRKTMQGKRLLFAHIIDFRSFDD